MTVKSPLLLLLLLFQLYLVVSFLLVLFDDALSLQNLLLLIAELLVFALERFTCRHIFNALCLLNQ